MINITARHLEITADLKAFIEDRCNRLIRYFDRISRIDVIVNFNKNIYEVEVIAKGPHRVTMVAHSTERNLINVIDVVFGKIEKQLGREKDKIKGHHGKGFKDALKEQKKTKRKKDNEFKQNDWY
ncbi:MAG: ribosome-associated translation inhibitor RaiA [Planctomycetes bacterium]|nr:ribosome-associated translation inhibitor RaiA [Planctomycetota bacterium]